ncbi:MAG: nucleoside triphosphate pyrophosphohydrolase, partial [Pseudomonadota bacterium]
MTSPDRTMSNLARLIAVMKILRDPETGCAWDSAQSFETIAPYTIEEAYEVRDAIIRRDMAALTDELGDLLLQVVFHSQIAADQSLFDIGDVAAAIVDKMERRHPHIFGGSAAAGDWETIKAAERNRNATGHTSALAGIVSAMPALMVAEKLQKRAARTGFDWPDASGPRAKVIEEIAEVDGAATQIARTEEVGDLLFAVVNWARHLGIDPES